LSIQAGAAPDVRDLDRIAQVQAMLTSRPSLPPDPALGRSVSVKTCQQCHTLFGIGIGIGIGGQVG
jgi:hypothetical protein